ncbi:MoaD/ThiS family protein [Arthrobacter sp. TMN-37]
MLIRYFGAARAAAGTAEETLDAAGVTVGEILAKLAVRHAGAGTPSMEQVLRRSSFLLNEVALRDRGRVLAEHDVLDVLPPFAGG